MGNEKKNECEPITNGWVCSVDSDKLNQITQTHHLNHQILKENNRSKVVLTDQEGKQVAVAFKNGESDIRLFSKTKIL